MAGWMIALIVIASVIAILAAAFFVGSMVAVESILGRKFKTPKGETAEKYCVDTAWFDEVKDCVGEEHITSFDGIDLGAMTVKHSLPEGSTQKRVAILQHGYRSSPRSVQPFAKILFDKGFDVYLPAARGLDISGGKLIGMAWLDRFDIMRWIDKVVEQYGADVQIALMGVSMGGATVAAVSGMQPPPQVKCIVDDCGFSSQEEEYKACVSMVKLPKRLVLAPLAVGVRLRQGYSIYDADIVPLVKNATVPMLFIHGEKDAFVPYALGKKLYEACGSADKRFESFDAFHAASYASDRERYTKIFTDFIDEHIKSPAADE